MKKRGLSTEITKDTIVELCDKWQRILKVKVNRIQIRKMKNNGVPVHLKEPSH